MQNEALLLKNLHKFFNKADLPWVQLLWNQYYSNGKVPRLARKGGFWWRSIVKLVPTYKGIAQATLSSRDSILFWANVWNGRVLEITYPELFSFTTNPSTVKTVTKMSSLQELFQLPLSVKAFDQFCELDKFMQSLQLSHREDTWSYIWGSNNFSSTKAYRHLLGSSAVHPTLKWTWKMKCQTKHKVFFFWLLL
jgi:hypothetical protein